jgi:Na+-driven multidrug efflux pump
MMTVGNASRGEVIPRGANYLRLISFTLVPTVISSAIGSSLRETGETKVPLYISAIATMINTIGNWFLIYGNLGAPRLEISGAAIATVMARLFEMSAYIIYANRKKIGFYSPFRYIFKVSLLLVKKIISKSLFMFISEASWVTAETIMVALYNGRGGAETMAGMSAGSTIANIFFLLFGGIWTIAAVLVGGSLGAGKLDEARSRGKWLLSGAFIAGAAVAIFGAIISYFLIPLVFSNLTLQARGIGLGLVFVILAYFPVWAIINAQFAICRAGGDTFMGLIVDGAVNIGIIIPGAFLLARLTKVGPVGMFGIIKSTDILKCFIARYFYNKERWVKNLTT